jgi:ribosomal protein S8
LVTRIKIKNILYKEIIVVNDTISDMLTRIQKCQYGKTSNCSNSCYKNVFSNCKILKEEGFIEDFESYKKIKKNTY